MVDDAMRRELEERAARAQELMRPERLDAIVVSSEVNFRYFTGVRSQFFASPTRPWFALLPRDGKPLAIVAETARLSMAETSWIEDVRTWISPHPDDEGVSLVAAAIAELPRTFGRIGAELGPETRLGMPAGDFLRLSELIAPQQTFVDGSGIVSTLRRVKSASEIATLRTVHQIVSAGFACVPELYDAGDSERTLCRKLELEVLRRGADKAPYLVADAGQGGYVNPASSPSTRTLRRGDVLFIDAGFTLDGYYSDFNRNWSLGKPHDAARKAYEVLHRATDAGLAAAEPGARAADVWRAMTRVLEREGGAARIAGRLGHGVGLQLTEAPSLSEGDRTTLTPGTVITIEPGLVYDGSIMLHEEVVAVTEDGPELLTVRAAPELPIIEV